MTDASIDRFADYSDDELGWLLADLQRGGDDRLKGLVAAIIKELERRRSVSAQA